MEFKNLPKETGVYLAYEEDELLYIGKALNIQKRINQHIKSGSVWIPKANRIDFILTENEKRALETERDLVQRLSPKYNVLLRDDKRNAFIEITYKDEYPRVVVTRKRGSKKSKYFGPYQSKRRAEKIVAVLPKIFPFRSCQGKEPGLEVSPCLDFYLSLCQAPCVYKNSQKKYQESIKKIDDILSGKTKDILESLRLEMKEYSSRSEFEKAAQVRDRIKLIESIEGRAFFGEDENLDFVVFLPGNVFINKIRSGKASGSDFLQIENETIDKESIFFSDYYKNSPMPKEIIASGIEDDDLIASFSLIYPKTKLILSPRLEKKTLLENAKKTAELKVKKSNATPKTDVPLGLDDLEKSLGFSIKRIEGYDVSNLGGADGYVSMVVFEDGVKKKSDYRIFSANYKKPDDYRALRKALSKRKASFFKGEDSSFSEKPDLVIIDGGKGQLSAGIGALEGFVSDERIISIAKKEERVFSKKRELLIQDTAGWRLIMRVRDEAHRFALSRHRKKRSKKMRASALESIEGLGPKRIAAIEKEIKDIKTATVDDFEKIEGISSKMAEKIYRSLNRR